MARSHVVARYKQSSPEVEAYGKKTSRTTKKNMDRYSGRRP